MTLISCDSCGVVLDKSKIDIENPYDSEFNINTKICVYDNGFYYNTIECPVCKYRIPDLTDRV